MLPVVQLGPLSIQTYPLALLLAGWTALAVGAWAARRLALEGDHIYNAGLYGLLIGLIASRAGHVIAFWPAYRAQPLEIIGLNPRAFLLWPGIVAGLIVAGWYVQRHKLPWGTVLDAAAPGALVGITIGDLGALLAGRAAGAITAAPWAITVWGVARHPSQLYEMLAALVILAVTLRMLKTREHPGTIAWVGLLGYGLSRWLLEPFRAESTTVLNGLRVPQLLGLAATLIALWALRGNIRSTPPRSEDM